MARRTKSELVKALLRAYGRTYAEELGIDLERAGSSDLFRLLVAALLFSARIRSSVAVRAARELFGRGWTTPQKMADAPWEARVKALDQAGYVRYDERTATMLGDTSRLLLTRYGGDLRRLREEAERDPARERGLLKEFKGIGDVGVDIFFREAQVAWGELRPFADRRALEAAKRLGLGGDAQSLRTLVRPKEFPRLVTALVRARLEGNLEELRRRG